MKTVLTVAAGVALGVALGCPRLASAAITNLLSDGSLETALAPDQYDLITASPTQRSNALAGWTITKGTINVVPNSYWQSPVGSFSVDLIGTPYYNKDLASAVPSLGEISQNIATTIGVLYTLTFDLSANPENLTGEVGSTKRLVITATPAGVAQPAIVGSGTPAPDGTQTYDVAKQPGQTKSNMMYTSETFEFTASSTLTTLSLAALMPTGLPASYNPSNVFCGPVVGDLQLISGGVSPAPEPASLSLLGIGSLLLLRRRSRVRG